MQQEEIKGEKIAPPSWQRVSNWGTEHNCTTWKESISVGHVCSIAFKWLVPPHEASILSFHTHTIPPLRPTGHGLPRNEIILHPWSQKNWGPNAPTLPSATPNTPPPHLCGHWHSQTHALLCKHPHLALTHIYNHININTCWMHAQIYSRTLLWILWTITPRKYGLWDIHKASLHHLHHPRRLCFILIIVFIFWGSFSCSMSLSACLLASVIYFNPVFTLC